MHRKFFTGSVALALAALFLVGGAQAEDWKIVQSRGAVWIGSDKAQRASFGPATVVPGGATLTTGKDARVVLLHGTQTMIVGPDTVVTLPAGDSKGITTILQRAGEVTFDVDRQKVRHFAVETPFLAAVVKGTRFTVSVDDNGARVRVRRGLVGVTDLATGEQADTPRWHTATVEHGRGLSVSGFGRTVKIVKGKSRRPLVDALTPVQTRALSKGTLAASNGLALGQTAVARNPNGIGLAVGLGGGNAGGVSALHANPHSIK